MSKKQIICEKDIESNMKILDTMVQGVEVEIEKLMTSCLNSKKGETILELCKIELKEQTEEIQNLIKWLINPYHFVEVSDESMKKFQLYVQVFNLQCTGLIEYINLAIENVPEEFQDNREFLEKLKHIIPNEINLQFNSIWKVKKKSLS